MQSKREEEEENKVENLFLICKSNLLVLSRKNCYLKEKKILSIRIVYEDVILFKQAYNRATASDADSNKVPF